MKHRILFFITLVISIALFSPTRILAQSADEEAPTLRFVCLDAVSCASSESDCSVNHIDRFRLTTENQKAVVNAAAFVTECLEVPGENNTTNVICTTANSTLDRELNCGVDTQNNPSCDNFQRLKDTLNYSISADSTYGVYHGKDNEFVKKTPPSAVQSDASGNLPTIEWQSTLVGGTTLGLRRRFMVWNQITNQEAPEGAIGGQQQATLSFISRSSSCEGIAYDPYGRAFDTVTLEPIPNINLMISMLNPGTDQFDREYAEISNKYTLLENPLITLVNGAFSFFGVPGMYKIEPSDQSGRYTHADMTITALNNAVPSVNQVYSDFYFASSEAIDETQKAQHRDIPMVPNTSTGYRYDVVEMSLYPETTLSGEEMTIAGHVSHPFAEIHLVSCPVTVTEQECKTNSNSYPTIAVFNEENGGPDKNGRFKITYQQDLLEPDSYAVLVYKAVDLTQNDRPVLSFIKKITHAVMSFFGGSTVEAAEKTTVGTVVHPIPNYLEGFAYDGQGNIMTNARVGIYVQFSGRPVYTTMTNQNGYFRITSENIPRTQYTIQYSSESNTFGKTVITTSQFLSQNQTFHTAENINSFKSVTENLNPRRTITPSFVPNQQVTPPLALVSPTTAKEKSTQTTQETTNQTNSNNMTLVMGSLLLILGVAGGLVAWHMLRKRMNSEK